MAEKKPAARKPAARKPAARKPAAKKAAPVVEEPAQAMHGPFPVYTEVVLSDGTVRGLNPGEVYQEKE